MNWKSKTAALHEIQKRLSTLFLFSTCSLPATLVLPRRIDQQPDWRRSATERNVFAFVDNTETQMIVATESSAQYASRYLRYRAGTGLVAQRFDQKSGSLPGPAIPLVNNVRDDVGATRWLRDAVYGLEVFSSGSYTRTVASCLSVAGAAT